MHVITSDWLKRMVMKSATNPEARITSLFAILQDWLEAPGMRELLLADNLDNKKLHAFVFSLVTEAKLLSPEKTAFQLQYMLLGAINAELRNPGNGAMACAGEAAAIIVESARPPRFAKPAITMASLVMFVFIVGALLIAMALPQKKAIPVTVRIAPKTDIITVASRPDRLAAIYQMHERIQVGQCSYPQALMLAPEQRAPFMQGVVNIDSLNTASSNLEEVSRLYQKVECSYAPAAMLL